MKGMASSVMKGNGKNKNNKGSDLGGSFLQSPEAIQILCTVDHTTPTANTSLYLTTLMLFYLALRS